MDDLQEISKARVAKGDVWAHAAPLLTAQSLYDVPKSAQ